MAHNRDLAVQCAKQRGEQIELLLLVSEEQKQQQGNSGAMQGLGEAGLDSRAAVLLEEGSCGEELSRAAKSQSIFPSGVGGVGRKHGWR